MGAKNGRGQEDTAQMLERKRWRRTDEQMMTLGAQGSESYRVMYAGSRSLGTAYLHVTGCEGTTGCGEKRPA